MAKIPKTPRKLSPKRNASQTKECNNFKMNENSNGLRIRVMTSLTGCDDAKSDRNRVSAIINQPKIDCNFIDCKGDVHWMHAQNTNKKPWSAYRLVASLLFLCSAPYRSNRVSTMLLTDNRSRTFHRWSYFFAIMAFVGSPVGRARNSRLSSFCVVEENSKNYLKNFQFEACG